MKLRSFHALTLLLSLSLLLTSQVLAVQSKGNGNHNNKQFMQKTQEVKQYAQVSQNFGDQYPMTQVKPNKLNWRGGIYEDEIAEIFHFFLFADAENVYYYDPFREKSEIRPLAVGFKNIQKIIANSRRDFLFVADYDEDNDLETVYRYAILWDFNDTLNPLIYLNKTSKIRQYIGPKIHGMCNVEDDSYLFAAVTSLGRIYKHEYTAWLFDNYNNYIGNQREVEYRWESVNNVRGAACDEASNSLYWFNSMTGDTTDMTMYRGNMDEDDDPFDQLKKVYKPSHPSYMEEVVYYISNNQDLYGYIEDGGVNLLIAQGYKNVSDLYTYKGMIFVSDPDDALFMIRLEEGHYKEQVAINATGIRSVTMFVNSFGLLQNAFSAIIGMGCVLLFSFY